MRPLVFPEGSYNFHPRGQKAASVSRRLCRYEGRGDCPTRSAWLPGPQRGGLKGNPPLPFSADPADTYGLKDARKLCLRFSRLKKHWLTSTTSLQNRYLLRQGTCPLPAASPRIDLAALIQTDPQRLWITGRRSLGYHTCPLGQRGVDTGAFGDSYASRRRRRCRSN